MERRWNIRVNAPVTLGFAAICLIAMVVGQLTGGASNYLLFMNYRAPLTDPLTYLRFFTHVFGHASWEHLYSNMIYLLLLGPLLEEKYGSGRLIAAIALSAGVTGLANYLLFPHQALLGASGVVFTFILLSSATSFREGEIPLTFIIVGCLFLGQELYAAIFVHDNVSNLTHILGGVVGGAVGLASPRQAAGSRIP